MAPHNYESEWPSHFANQEVKDFMVKFYEALNHPKAHEEYASLFTRDGTLVFASSEAKGTKNIHKLREEIWSNIPRREHRCLKVYPFDKEGYDLMVLGAVEYKHHDDHEKGLDWAARYQLVKENGELKMALARIFFDTADQRSDK